MLFFFEAGFFVLAVAALVLAEFVGRGQALALWGSVIAASFVARRLVLARNARRPAANDLEARWRRMLSDSWGHFNKLLLIGLAALAAWWWLGR